MGGLNDAVAWASKAGKLETYKNDLQEHRNPLRFFRDVVQDYKANSEAWAKGANTPEKQQDPETEASRQAAQEEVKRKGGGTVLSRHRLGMTGAATGANKLGVGVQ